jgi:hypothetical protein
VHKHLSYTSLTVGDNSVLLRQQKFHLLHCLFSVKTTQHFRHCMKYGSHSSITDNSWFWDVTLCQSHLKRLEPYIQSRSVRHTKKTQTLKTQHSGFIIVVLYLMMEKQSVPKMYVLAKIRWWKKSNCCTTSLTLHVQYYHLPLYLVLWREPAEQPVNTLHHFPLQWETQTHCITLNAWIKN